MCCGTGMGCSTRRGLLARLGVGGGDVVADGRAPAGVAAAELQGRTMARTVRAAVTAEPVPMARWVPAAYATADLPPPFRIRPAAPSDPVPTPAGDEMTPTRTDILNAVLAARGL